MVNNEQSKFTKKRRKQLAKIAHKPIKTNKQQPTLDYSVKTIVQCDATDCYYNKHNQCMANLITIQTTNLKITNYNETIIKPVTYKTCATYDPTPKQQPSPPFSTNKQHHTTTTKTTHTRHTIRGVFNGVCW